MSESAGMLWSNGRRCGKTTATCGFNASPAMGGFVQLSLLDDALPAQSSENLLLTNLKRGNIGLNRRQSVIDPIHLDRQLGQASIDGKYVVSNTRKCKYYRNHH